MDVANSTFVDKRTPSNTHDSMNAAGTLESTCSFSDVNVGYTLLDGTRTLGTTPISRTLGTTLTSRRSHHDGETKLCFHQRHNVVDSGATWGQTEFWLGERIEMLAVGWGSD